ncbi:MAG: TonB-dependent receptor [Novosphingobium sp.]|uniref:TonB-dependent receptor n=1 Tax=Novosphingobium sp. TaxID=1874826 RepID=UPI002735B04F|nr:TonB-dependent receptor [Novosphingobium sp.]MDP3549072.1 TonB-dependent receptor [Novosphingobium sp.]
MNRFTLLAAAAFIPVLTTPAFAQDVSAEDMDDIVVVAKALNATQVMGEGDLGALGRKKAEDVPFTIRAYNEALILNQQPQTLGQVLENDPTVRTSYGFGNAAEQFVIRGFALYGDDVGLNGLYGIAPRQLIAPELFQSVEVLNGASAFLNGAAPGGTSIGGAVNLQLKRAGDDALNRVTVGYISDANFGGSFDVSRRFGDDGAVGVRLNAAFRSGDVATDGEFRRTAVVGAAFDWRDDNTRLFLDLGYQRVEVDGLRPKVTIGTTTIPAVPGASANYSQPWSYTDLRDVFGVLRFEQDFGDNAMFHISGGARDGSEQGIYGGVTVLDAATGAANGNGLYVPRTDNNEAVEAGFTVKLGNAITQEINFGGSAVWQVNRNAFDFLYGPGFAGFATNIYDAPEAAIPASAFVGGDLDNPFPISRTRLLSAFASDTVGLFGDRVLLTGGLRLQDIEVKSYNAYNGGLLDGTYRESAVTPVIGLVVKPVPGLSLFANRVEALQQGPSAPVDALVVNAGEVFGPIRSKQYEVGGKLRLGRFEAGLSVFRIDLPVAYSVDAGTGDGRVRFGLNGLQRNEGVEFTLNGEPVDGLRFIGGASVIDAKLRRTLGGANQGNRAVGVPEWTGNAGVEWDIPSTGFTLTGRVVHTGKQAVNVANTLEIPDWTRFDLGARYVLITGGKPLTLRAGVDNVANKRYWASAFDVFSAALLQGQPRTFRASASIDF